MGRQNRAKPQQQHYALDGALVWAEWMCICIFHCCICLLFLRSNKHSIAHGVAFASVALSFANASTLFGDKKKLEKQQKSRANAPEAILNHMTAVIHDFTCAAWLDYLDAVHGPVMQRRCCFLAVVCRITVAWTEQKCIYTFQLRGFRHICTWSKPPTHKAALFASCLCPDFH